jgi:hypothetical protein
VPEFVKIQFALEADADGWPPAATEGLWAVPLGQDTFRVDKTPWFVPGIACGDVVRAERRDEEWWYLETVQWSGNCTIRVTPFRHGPLQGDRQAVLGLFAPLGIKGERIEQFGMVVLDVPPQADLTAAQALLLQGFDAGWWDYDEGRVGEAWARAAHR